MSPKKFMVTSALPYANGQIHLGHIAGAYLPADIFVRFQRLASNEAVFICGTDEHGVPITLRAEQENVSPRAIVKRYHDDIQKAFERMNIIFDNFSGTSAVHNKYHASLAREFFTKLLHNNYITSHLSDQFYCTECKRFLPDRFVYGKCPKCQYTEARGDECPECRSQFETLELKNPKCKICNSSPIVQPTKHWYLRLDILQKELEQWIDTKNYWKENVINFVKGWFKQGLKERAITRDLYWGVPLPLEEAAGKVLYVWFDAPIGYISSTMEWAEKQGDVKKWQEYWQNPDCQIIHYW
jgi:methionyl-tRNA synthetase